MADILPSPMETSHRLEGSLRGRRTPTIFCKRPEGQTSEYRGGGLVDWVDASAMSWPNCILDISASKLMPLAERYSAAMVDLQLDNIQERRQYGL